jgi:enamine deaminase RidA (YjgF/YER057c/UK114 family)
MVAIITAIFGAYDYSAPEVLSYMEGGMSKPALSVAAIMSAAVSSTPAQQLSPNGVKTLAPAGAIKPTGTWDLGTRAGDFIFIAGMRGIDPKTDTLVEGDEARIRQAFLNMKLIAESEGATLRDAVRLVVYVTDMFRFRPLVNKIQAELWGQGPYPPRTIVEVHRLNQDDIVEIEGTFYAPKAIAQPGSPSLVKTLAPAGAIKPTGTWNLGARAGDLVYVAGMRGIDPKTDTLINGDEERVHQAFMNMKLIAESEDATLRDAVRLVVYTTDMFRFRPLVNKIQSELWGQGPYPPRTIVEIHRLNQDDIVEVEGTFLSSASRAASTRAR